MRLKTVLILVVVVFAALATCKRSRGRSRGSSSGSSWSLFSRKNKNSEGKPPPPKPVETKPSAPREPAIQKQNANVQQSGRPVGWVDPHSNIQKQNAPPVGNPPPYSPHGNPPPYGAHPQGNPPPYSPQQPHMNPPPYSAANPYGGAYPPAYSPHNPHMGPPAYPQGGGYHQQQGAGYGGYQQQGAGYGGYQQPGLFGGTKPGFGGYGGYGGYGYGMKKSGGFLGQHAFRNILGGLAVGYLISGMLRTPYRVYNYHNYPPEMREEITLPPNVLTLCNENATNLCVPGNTAICTQDSRILCVATMSATAPCHDSTGLCVNSTIPCLDANDPLCQNTTVVDNTTTISLPCFTNMTLEKGQVVPNVTLPPGDTYCVTSLAVPDPSIPIEDDKGQTGNSTVLPVPRNLADVPQVDVTGTDGNNGTAPVKE